jgi:adenylate kinase family enzyme
MVYIIGGLPHSGKKLLGKYLSKQYGIPGFDTDLLRHMFNANPTSKIGFISNSSVELVTQELWPYIDHLILSQINIEEDFYISGEVLSPKLVSKYIGFKNCQICFMGYSDIQAKFRNLRQYALRNDWTRRLTDQQLIDVLTQYQERSLAIQAECEEVGIKYFDTSSVNPLSQITKHAQLKAALGYLIPEALEHKRILPRIFTPWHQ